MGSDGLDLDQDENKRKHGSEHGTFPDQTRTIDPLSFQFEIPMTLLRGKYEC